MSERARMPEAFALRIVTPEQSLLDERVLSVRASAVDGQLGLLVRHAPMIAELAIGELLVRDPSGRVRHFAMTGGVLRVERDGVIVLADAAEEAQEIDAERARMALERAEERLHRPIGAPGVDSSRAELALARALNRLRVAGRAGQ